ncbi:hypothetical protein KIW84_022725 [Lathyrus oleraceus]|uniref:Uncharacterized protein n=1 Tax=Pisum sativum TaxID=3888 RepID=A0A9D5BB25_PEA|nr:hypothetical protein KIW84_022725 [Pisum sativum]
MKLLLLHYKTDLPESGQLNVAFVAMLVCRSLEGRDFDEVLFYHFAAKFKEGYKIDVLQNALKLRIGLGRRNNIMIHFQNMPTLYSAIDVWSVGCILMEIIRREPVFPGKYYVQQLALITELLGSPNGEDLGFLRIDNAKNMLSSFRR